MPKLLRIAFALLLAAFLLAVPAGCGEDRSNLLPGDTTEEILANLDQVEALVEQGECFEALDAAEAVRGQVEALDRGVDEDLRRTLLDGVTQLQITIQDTCDTEATTDAEPVEPDPVELEPVDPVEPDPAGGATGDTGGNQGNDQQGGGNQQGGGGNQQPQRPTPTPTPEPTPEPTPPPAPTPPDSGGVGPSNGGR
jgi:hypothetical protein